MMTKGYQNLSVYEAVQQRFHYLFREFPNIYVSFSGGKDSGVLLHLLLDFKRKYYPDRRIGVFHQDFEAQYTVTTEYITRTFKALEGECDLYWVCLPMATRTALSSYEMYWYPWDDAKEELWVANVRIIHMSSRSIILFTIILTKCIRKILQNSLAVFIKNSMGIRIRSVCLAYVRMSPCRDTAVSSIKGTAIRENAGFPNSLRTYGALRRSMTGQSGCLGCKLSF